MAVLKRRQWHIPPVLALERWLIADSEAAHSIEEVDQGYAKTSVEMLKGHRNRIQAEMADLGKPLESRQPTNTPLPHADFSIE